MNFSFVGKVVVISLLILSVLVKHYENIVPYDGNSE